ncbi:unnamed protein product [Caenorhabditis auriculariae]|uniref:Uncharacterized protein n=1 Tax=Caenorhabditis auriculariae TaxID=2777116 RepID=A0A8S1HBV4_9PELO|nr:unnamed protein product [Caenorhabditis auriculariae]
MSSSSSDNRLPERYRCTLRLERAPTNSSAVRRSTSEESDISSLCNSISNIVTKTFSRVSSTVTARNEDFSPPGEPQADPERNYCLGRTFDEATRFNQPLAPMRKVTFDALQSVQEVHVLSQNSTFPKCSSRGTNNPWRRYGALKKICQVGGFAPTGESRTQRKNRMALVHIESGTNPPPPPPTCQMTLNRVRDKTGKNQLNIQLEIDNQMQAEELACSLAQQIKAHVMAQGESWTRKETAYDDS